MHKVYLPTKNDRYDASLAEEYGEILLLYEGHLNPFNTDECVHLITQAFKLNKFDCDNDYICMTGQSLILSFTLAIAISLYGKVNLLLFDATTNKYRCRKLCL